MGIWIAAPLSFSLFHLGTEKKPFSVARKFVGDYLRDKIDLVGGKCTQIILSLVFLPIDFFFACVFTYVVIPYASFKRSFLILMGIEFSDYNDRAFQIDYEYLPKKHYKRYI